MKIQVIMRTKGQPDAIVGEAEGETFEEVQTETADLFDKLAQNLRNGDSL